MTAVDILGNMPDIDVMISEWQKKDNDRMDMPAELACLRLSATIIIWQAPSRATW